MSIKRYKSDIRPTKEQNSRANTYSGILHNKLLKPKRYHVECGEDVHCITVMPNKAVHFHNHNNMEEMVHLVTFDMLQNPAMADSKLPSCLKVLRGLRTKTASITKGYSKTNLDSYIDELLSANLSNVQGRATFKTIGNPISWREEVLNKYRKSIAESLKKNLHYYGMNNEGYYNFHLKFDFCLAPRFTPSAVMALNKEYNRGSDLWLNVTVSPKWLINVWLKNRAIVADTLILSLEKEYPNGTTLCLAAKQSHGFKIKPKMAVVDFEREVVSWLNDDKKQEFLHQDKMPRMRRRKKEVEKEKEGITSPIPVPVEAESALIPLIVPKVDFLTGMSLTPASYTEEQLKVITYRSEHHQEIYSDGLECKCQDPAWKNCYYCNTLSYMEVEEIEEDE